MSDPFSMDDSLDIPSDECNFCLEDCFGTAKDQDITSQSF